MSYRTNPTDKQQNEMEGVASSQGIPVQAHAKTRVVAKAAQTAPYNVSKGTATGSQRNNAGVVMPHDDAPGRFVQDQQGKA